MKIEFRDDVYSVLVRGATFHETMTVIVQCNLCNSAITEQPFKETRGRIDINIRVDLAALNDSDNHYSSCPLKGRGY